MVNFSRTAQPTNDYPVQLYPSTPMMMSAIHPRTKAHVGRRLAQAAWAVAYGHDDEPSVGPVIAGCTVDTTGDFITVGFNTSLLKSDSFVFKVCLLRAHFCVCALGVRVTVACVFVRAAC